VTVRLPIDCEGGRPAAPIKLVTGRPGDLVAAAHIEVKKSA
jgi:hypothetical protein